MFGGVLSPPPPGWPRRTHLRCGWRYVPLEVRRSLKTQNSFPILRMSDTITRTFRLWTMSVTEDAAVRRRTHSPKMAESATSWYVTDWGSC